MSDALELAERALAHVGAPATRPRPSSTRSARASRASRRRSCTSRRSSRTPSSRCASCATAASASRRRTARATTGSRARGARRRGRRRACRADPTFPGFRSRPTLPERRRLRRGDRGARPGRAGTARGAQRSPRPAPRRAYGFFTSGVDGARGRVVDRRRGEPAHDRRDRRSCSPRQTARPATRRRRRRRSSGVDPRPARREAAREGGADARRGRARAGAYRAVLEPYAFAELLQYFAYDAFGALGLLEERSYLAGRHRRAHLRREGVDRRRRARPRAASRRRSTSRASPKQRVPLIENGVARGVVWDRATAKRAGGDARTTGHAPPAAWQAYGPLAFALSVAGGEADSVDELVAAVGDGIYVTRLHYLGIVDPRDGVITGMTRDGTFRIRDGKIAEPLVNLRFTVSVPKMLADVPGLSRERHAREPQRLLRRALSVRRARAGDRHRALQHHRQRLDARALAHASRARSRRCPARSRASRARAARRTARPPLSRSGSSPRRILARSRVRSVSHDVHVEVEVAPRRGEQRRAVASAGSPSTPIRTGCLRQSRGRGRARRGRRAPAVTASRRRGPRERAARSPGARRCRECVAQRRGQARRPQPVDGGEVVTCTARRPSRRRARRGCRRAAPALRRAGRGGRAPPRDAARPCGRRSRNAATADDDLAGSRAHDVERS